METDSDSVFIMSNHLLQVETVSASTLPGSEARRRSWVTLLSHYLSRTSFGTSMASVAASSVHVDHG